eukprot:TRINITY_DN22604_c1_g1_i1.p1 TRINITY_DN22604_c1_g1~~TRINITY_DN22604_c1_g1_i1.p1  ORF type:complete len:117 (+),score=5.50 TRINITY_DN22604_c1_g1_i1:55-405(+)
MRKCNKTLKTGEFFLSRFILSCLMTLMLVLQSSWEKGIKTGDDMAFGPKGERVLDAMECMTLVYVLHAHNHWSLLVGYVDENCWEYYNSSLGEIWGRKTSERFVSIFSCLGSMIFL